MADTKNLEELRRQQKALETERADALRRIDELRQSAEASDREAADAAISQAAGLLSDAAGTSTASAKREDTAIRSARNARSAMTMLQTRIDQLVIELARVTDAIDNAQAIERKRRISAVVAEQAPVLKQCVTALGGVFDDFELQRLLVQVSDEVRHGGVSKATIALSRLGESYAAEVARHDNPVRADETPIDLGDPVGVLLLRTVSFRVPPRGDIVTIEAGTILNQPSRIVAFLEKHGLAKSLEPRQGFVSMTVEHTITIDNGDGTAVSIPPGIVSRSELEAPKLLALGARRIAHLAAADIAHHQNNSRHLLRHGRANEPALDLKSVADWNLDAGAGSEDGEDQAQVAA